MAVCDERVENAGCRIGFSIPHQIVNELRELPLSTERQHWAPESLREKDLKALSIEKRVRERVFTVFARIADNLKQYPDRIGTGPGPERN